MRQAARKPASTTISPTIVLLMISPRRSPYPVNAGMPVRFRGIAYRSPAEGTDHRGLRHPLWGNLR